MEKKLTAFSHLFVTVFLSCLASFIVVPAITDVTMFALCPGTDECSLAIYLTGFQQTADNISDSQRASAFGILSGVSSGAYVCATLAARFLSTASTFQVATLVSMLAVVYMRIFLEESIPGQVDGMTQPILKEEEDDIQKDVNELRKMPVSKKIPSLGDIICLLKSSPAFSQAAVVAFFRSLAEGGMVSSSTYYLKARFHFNKNQFADLLLISGVVATISQLFLLPLLVSPLGDGRLLSIGLLVTCLYAILYCIAWSAWVPYAATALSIAMVLAPPSLSSIVSKHAGARQQGKAQGCISGVSSLANVIAPLIFSPLTALFLSEDAPFHFPGFSIMCIAISSMIAFIQSLIIDTAPSDKNNSNCMEV
ncbi:hypothetical protein DITRI_Ditri08aG0141400 [Diplodiscus trichospermus]